MLLTAKETHTLARVSRVTLWRYVRDGIAPKPLKIGGVLRFRKSEIEKWLGETAPVACDEDLENEHVKAEIDDLAASIESSKKHNAEQRTQ